jgi:nucleobase:cation symporter-1, NCS1 family
MHSTAHVAQSIEHRASAVIEQHSIDYIPLAERHGKVWQLWPVWFSGSAHLATLAVGVLGIALGGNLFWSAAAVVFGCAFGTFFMAFHSTQGPQLGLPQMIQSRPQFGYMGALLVWGVALIAYIGYNAFNQVLAAQAVHQLPVLASANAPVTIMVFAALAAVIAAVGYDWIHRAQRVVAYGMITALLIFALSGAGIAHLPPAQTDVKRFVFVPFLAQFFAAASYQLSWSIYVSDYSRYLPRDVGVRASFWWTYVGAFAGGAAMMLLGTIAAALHPKLDVAAAMKTAADSALPGLGTVLMIGGLIGLVTISALNFYGASLTLLSVADSIKPVRCTIASRLVTLLIALLGAAAIALLASNDFVNRFADLLAVLLYLLTPWSAINLIDFYVVRRGQYSVREIFNPHGLYGRWNWRGLLAYAVGFIAMIPFFSTGLYQGPVARALHGADLAMLVGLPVSTVVYLLACRSMDVTGELARAMRADADLDAAAPPRASI